MLRVTAGHDIEYPLKGAGTAVGYYLQDGLEPPGVWAGKARLYAGRPPRYVTGTEDGKDAEAEAAVAALDEFATPAEERRTRPKVLGSTGAAVPFYDLTFSATKSVSLLQASYAAAAARARQRGDTATADEFEAKVKAIDDAAVQTAAQVISLAEERALFVRTGHHSAHTGEFRDGRGAVRPAQQPQRRAEPAPAHGAAQPRRARRPRDVGGREVAGAVRQGAMG